MEQDLKILWQNCSQILRDNLTATAFETWFAPLEVVSFVDNKLVLRVKSEFVAQYIEENYVDLLSKAILRTFGPKTRLEYRVLMDSTTGAVATFKGANDTVADARQPILPLVQNTRNDWETQLSDSYTFSSFIEGETNKLARAVGLEIAKEPGRTVFNPLFIYGGSGVGKTHLANAIGNQIARQIPNARVLFISANTFKLQFQEAVKQNKLSDFLLFYQSVDVLIVDDVQYFSGLKGTQDTFFHIFNYLHQSRKQLIMTSDRSPLQLKDVEERLLTRFKWGLAVEIQRPDFTLRKAILHDRIQRDGLELPDEIVDYIAMNACNNIRDIEGILAALLAHSTLMNCDIDLKLVKSVVDKLVDVQPKTILMEDVIGLVCEHEGISEHTIVSKSRQREVNRARQLIVYLAKQLTDRSYNDIGMALGHRSHATVLHAYNVACDQQSYDTVFAHDLRLLEDQLKK
ncbi:MAG: chromosomal replication initiator protein DnaA [Paludibacteraceae bacterium]|nr:chromosomal replication initiator protein DnaA [Paludibacteraceae bacterium]